MAPDIKPPAKRLRPAQKPAEPAVAPEPTLKIEPELPLAQPAKTEPEPFKAAEPTLQPKTFEPPSDGSVKVADHPDPLAGLQLHSKPKSRLFVVLMIAVVVLILSLAGSGAFLYYKLKPKTAVAPTEQIDAADVTTVQDTTWVAPELPASYQLRQQNSDTNLVNMYTDYTAGCDITTTIQPIENNPNLEELVVANANSAAKVTTNAKGQDYQIKDADNVHQYNFASTEIKQEVTASGIGFGKFASVVLYKQFNYQLATLTFGCKDADWTAKQPALQELIKNFMVKTERIT